MNERNLGKFYKIFYQYKKNIVIIIVLIISFVTYILT